MGFLSSLFSKIRNRKNNTYGNSFLTPIIKSLNDELSSKDFISKYEFLLILEKYKHIKDEITSVRNAKMLSEYCEKHNVSKEEIDTFLLFYEDDSVREQHNNKYCKLVKSQEDEYFHHILDDIDPNIKLDDEQINVLIRDEDNTLVIAGAGAGKTTTVAAKVKYLVDKKGVNPDDILLISFTNKAVDELKERINKRLKIACKVSTFHRVGFDLINNSEDKKIVVEEGFLYNSVRDYLKTKILNDKNMSSKILLLFASYLDAPNKHDIPLDELFEIASKKEFSTLRSDLKEELNDIQRKREARRITIKNEKVASHQELQIANFLYINGIDYIYEDPYKYHIEGASKIYTPDFHIFQGNKEAYLEHFGMIDDKGKNNKRTPEEIKKYTDAIKDKIKLHTQHGTTLLKTYGGFSDGLDLIEHLKRELLSNGFELHQRQEEEVLRKIIDNEQDKYIGRLVKFIKSFIQAFKVNGYTSGYFKILYGKTKNVRDRLFLEICEGAYNNYENDLRINYAIDFSDMINDSVDIIREMQRNGEKIHYKYIIIDEYQDISHQRYNLTKELSHISDAKIIAVGDDWQSIYAFSGSDITLFTDFKGNIRSPKFGCECLYINHTYRNAQQLIDIAGTFVLKNTTQIKKSLISHKSLQDPVIIYSYCDDETKIKENFLRNSYFQRARALEAILDQIIAEDPSILNRDTGKEPILLIGRYGFDAERLSVGNIVQKNEYSEIEKEPYNIFDYDDLTKKVISKKYPTLRMAFMTAHSSKGLTYDHVIIINALNGVYGFPSKKEDDVIMDLVLKRDKTIAYAEERRLFYVALTRTSNRVYIVSPETKPSEFVNELINDKGYKNVVVKGEFNERVQNTDVYYCPDCGFPLQYRENGRIGLPLYVCTNEHELCGFMTNNVKGGRLRIQKCSKCQGYLIVKKKKDENAYFLGCENFDKNTRGCTHTMSLHEFNVLNPNTVSKQYHPIEETKQNRLVYKGEKIVHLDPIKPLEEAAKLKETIIDPEILKKKEERRILQEEFFEAKLQDALFKTLIEKAESYSNKVHHVVNIKRDTIAYVKEGRSWYWFVIDCKTRRFSFRYKRTSDFKYIDINENNIYIILQKIEELVVNFYTTKNKTMPEDDDKDVFFDKIEKVECK